MGHPVLRTKTKPIAASDVTTAEVQQLIDDMIATMFEYNGAGLAAPQVHEGIRLFVAHVPEDNEAQKDGAEKKDDRTAIVVVNPEITPVGRQMDEDWEGCLSIPDMRGLVPRYRDIRVRGLDRKGEPVELEATGFTARVIQHETDHLDGVLFLDRMKSLRNLAFLEEYARYHAKRDE